MDWIITFYIHHPALCCKIYYILDIDPFIMDIHEKSETAMDIEKAKKIIIIIIIFLS